MLYYNEVGIFGVEIGVGIIGWDAEYEIVADCTKC
jgi:hypothetical protein